MQSCSQPVLRLLAGCLLGASALAGLAGTAPAPALQPAAAPPGARRVGPPSAAPRSCEARRPAYARGQRLPVRRVAAITPGAPAGTVLDAVGRLAQAVPEGQVAAWKTMLHQGRLDREAAAWTHLWVGECELARQEEPERAIWHFQQARRLAGFFAPKGHEGPRTAAEGIDRPGFCGAASCSFVSLRGETDASRRGQECAGVAAYDTALSLFYAGAYEDAAAAFRHLRTGPAGLTGYDGARCLLWYRRAAAAAGYHASHARLGIPEPRRLDPLCAAAGLAVCLRGLGLPYDRLRVAAVCRHTGEGSSAQDLIAACRKLGLTGRLVHADDAGLRALPKPLVAHVEGDHFVAVVHTDARGVAYVCSDCGCWPGGRVELTWKQWHALQAGTFVTVTRPGTAADRALASLPDRPDGQPAPLRLASASLAQLHVWDAPQFSALLQMLKGHVFLISGTTVPDPKTQCGFKPAGLLASPFAHPPKDGPCARFGAAGGDPVNLATGEEEYGPAPDLVVYNPHGPQVVWRRQYRSLRGPGDDSYPWSRFGMGWNTGYDMVMADPGAITNPQAAQGATNYLTVTGTHAPATGHVWEIWLNGTMVASNLTPDTQWSVGIAPQGPSTLAVVVPADAAPSVGYEARYFDGATNYSASFDVTPPAMLPRGTALALATDSSDPPGANLDWDIVQGQSGVASSALPLGWDVVYSSVSHSLTVAAPITALTSVNKAYEVRLHDSTDGDVSAHFDVTALRVQYHSGPKTLVFPNGATVPVTAPAVPTATSPYVHCTVPAGVPLDVWWYYDGSPTVHFTITFHDGTQWVMGDASKSTGSAVYSLIAAITDPRITDGNGNPLGIGFRYGGDGLDGFPTLQTIVDNNNATLLTINRAPDPYREITSVTDAYQRSVYYTYPTNKVLNNPGVGGPWATYLELTGASTLLPAGQSNPAMHWTYGYGTYPNGISGESLRLLHTISIPSPTGTGTSTATINYDDTLPSDGLLMTVTSTVDANMNQRAYYSPDQNSQRAAGTRSQVVVSNLNDPTHPALVYTVDYNGDTLNLTDVTDASGVKGFHADYPTTGDVYHPTAVTIGATTDLSARTTQFQWGPYGNPTQVTSPRGTLTTYTWDYSQFVMGRLMQVQQGSKPPTSVTYYEPSGLPNDITSPAPAGSGMTTVDTVFFWSNLGNLTQVNRPGNNAAGTITTLLNYTSDPGDAAHGITAYSQAEAIGQPLTITDNANKVTHLRGYLRGNPTTVIDALGHQTVAALSLADQVQQVTYPKTFETGSGNATSVLAYPYDGGPLSMDTEFDESGAQVRQTALGYGPEGELLAQSGSTETASYHYDSTYKIDQLKDGNNHTTYYQHTLSGYLSEIDYPNGGGDKVTFPLYDGAGHALKRVDAKNVITSYAFSDPDGLLSGITYSDGTPSVSFGYDQYDRRMTMTDGAGSVTYGYGNLDELTSVMTQYAGWSAAQPLTYSYYPDGSRKSLQTPAGTFGYGFDLVGRMNALTNPYAENSSWRYMDNGWLLSQTLGDNITTSYTEDARGRITALQSVPSGQSYSSWFSGMKFDALGNRTFQQAFVPAVSAYSGSLTYGYNTRDELLSEVSTRGTGYTNNFVPDPAGNLTTIRGGSAVAYDADNQILGDPRFHYDLNGDPDLYWSMPLVHDAEHHLIQATPAAPTPQVSFGYNGDGLRAWKQVGSNPAARVYTLFDGSQPVVELDSTGTVLKAVNSFGANGLLSRNVVGGTNAFYTLDPQGSVCQRFDRTANLLSSDAYDAYGALLGTTQTGAHDVFGYGAQWGYTTDPETGLLLLTNRYYDPGTARFLTRDPIGAAGGANSYEFAANGPVSNIDPLGLYSSKHEAALIGVAALSPFGPEVQITGGLAVEALYEPVENLGYAVGCYESGQASLRDVVDASLGVAALGALSVVPAGGEVAAGEAGTANAAEAVSLDTNAIIARLEGTAAQQAEVDAAVAGRTPLVSRQAVKEYLVRGDVNALRAYLRAAGGRVGAAAPAQLVEELEIAGLGHGDAQVLGSAIVEDTALLTRDRAILRRALGTAQRY